jgi:carboxyl-terminal processing protease
VQTVFPVTEKSALKLTTGRWYTPSGRTIQRTARDEEEQMRLAAAEGVAAPDTAAEGDTLQRPVFHTMGGRVVRGGGGIVPDVVIRQDTLTEGERAFLTALSPSFSVYRDALTSTALDAKDRKLVTSEDFQVTSAMRQDVFRRMRDKGVKMSDEVFAGARTLLDEQLGYEIARYVFGRPAEFRRRTAQDRQMQAALDLLRQAQSPKDLLTLAATRAGVAQEN